MSATLLTLALGGLGLLLLGVAFGALLTALIQSWSAALAIILTASVTGVLTPLLGASLVIGANISTGLALFHTLFNLFGLLLMSVLADPILRRIEHRIRQPELLSHKTRYLDDTVLGVPAMGVAAI